MIKFKIEQNEYYIKDFLSLEDYSKIYKIKNLFTDQHFAVKVLNIITGAPIDDLMECPFEDISFLTNSIIKNIPVQDKINFVDRFELNGVHYGFFPDWRDMTFAEFIDLDTLSTKKENELLDVLHFIAAIMYRPITEEISKHNFKIEKYDVETMKVRAELFKKELDIKILLGGQFFFYQILKQILQSYPSIFGDIDEMEQIENDMDNVEDIVQNSFQESFGWFLVVNKITDNDFTKHDYIYKKGLNEVLNQLSFLISFEQEQIKLQKKAQQAI